MKTIPLIVIAVVASATALTILYQSGQINEPIVSSFEYLEDGEVREITNELEGEERERIVTNYIEENLRDVVAIDDALGGEIHLQSIEFSEGNAGVIEYESGGSTELFQFTYSIYAATHNGDTRAVEITPRTETEEESL